MTNAFKVYLDCLVSKDLRFHTYVDHCDTRPFDDIVLYSRWLACGSRLKCLHLPECVMQKFSYMQYIPRDPYVFVSPAMTRRVRNVIFDDYLNHMVSEKTHSSIYESD